MKKLLVIGGTYFVGRVFCILASRTGEFEITVVNRGRYELRPEVAARQIHFDRRDTEAAARLLPAQRFDAVVDFCAYEPGDIRGLLSAMPVKPGRYIFVSTCSVYDPQLTPPITEDAPVATLFGADENSVYVEKKLMLEKELRSACGFEGVEWTILRPALIFGPFNYAPREPAFFQMLLKKQPVPWPSDAAAGFSFVYVKDIAGILMGLIRSPEAAGRVYNLAGPDTVTWQSFMELLRKLHGEFQEQPMSMADAGAQGISFPFPTVLDEIYDGSRAVRDSGFGYTPFEKAFAETYDIYMNAYRQ